MRIKGNTGKGRIGAFIALVVLVLIIYGLLKFIPPFYRSGSFGVKLEELVRAAALDRSITNDDLIDDIFKEGGDLDLPITADMIDIERMRGKIRVTVRYNLEVKTPFHTFTFPQKKQAENKYMNI